tara:strand:- start:9562 stop:9822 length:261 start_codon:yes stop_codon:yes gene_type:complete
MRRSDYLSLELTLLIANFALLFIAYIFILNFFKKVSQEITHLDNKQQSTIYGVSHVWGSLKELREEIMVNFSDADPVEDCEGEDNE